MNAAVAVKTRIPSLPPSVRPKSKINRSSHAINRLRSVLESDEDEQVVVRYPPSVAVALAELTLKQRRFCLLRAVGFAGIHAYRASYNVSPEREDDAVYANVWQVEQNEKVKQGLKCLADWLDADWLADASSVQQATLSKLYDKMEYAKSDSDQISAAKLLMQAHGLLVDRKQVTHVDASSAEDSDQVLGQIFAQLAANVQPLQQTQESMHNSMCNHCRVVASATYEDGAGI